MEKIKGEEKMKNASKIVTLVFNILIGALSIMAIVGYVVMPFWTISVGVKFTPETKEAIMKIVDQSLNGDSGNTAYIDGKVNGSPVLMSANLKTGGETENGNGNGDSSKNKDTEMTRKIIEALLDNFANDKVDVSVPIKFSTSAIFSSLTAKDSTPVDKIIRSAVKESMDDKHLDKIITDVTKSTAKAMVDIIPTLLTDEQAADFEEGMEYIGLDEDYVKEQAAELAEALTTGKNTKNGQNKTLTKDGFTEDYLIPLMEDIMTKASDPSKSQYAREGNDVYADMNKTIFGMREENNASDFKKANENSSETYERAMYNGENYFEMKNGKKVINAEGRNIIKKLFKEQAFDTIWKDTDNIKLDTDTLKKLIQDAIGDDSSKNPDGNNTGNAMGYKLAGTATLAIVGYTAAATEEGGNGENTEETTDVTDELADNLTAQIDENTRNVLMIVMKVLAGLLIFSVVVWAYQLVKVIVNTLTGKMRTKMKLSIWCGWYPFMFFALIPNIALLALRKGWIPGLPAETASTLSLIKLTFNSSGMFAFIAAMAFIVIWIPYKIFAKKARD